MKLVGRTILTTGGSSGIGLELAGQLLARHNMVIITRRDEHALATAVRRFPGLHTFRSDASDAESIRALHESVIAQFPALDTLVNNASVMRILKLAEVRSLHDVTEQIDIDLSGAVRMVQQFLPHLQSRLNALIVNVSSGLAFVPLPLSPIYSAAKAGIHAYTRCLRAQLKGSNVTIVELALPLTQTPLVTPGSSDHMKGQKGMPVEVLARRTLAAIETGKTEIRPGQSNILKIASRLAPEMIFSQLSKVGRG